MRDRRNRRDREGVALIVVLFIVMAVTVLSLAYLSRSDVELVCGQNMILRTQMDYLADSGLEHARGLLLGCQDVSSEYWTGADGLQIVPGCDDYYDVNVVKLGECNYEVHCEGYRMKSGEKIGSSKLMAEVRLDPSIGLWVETTWTSEIQTTVNGDVYCNAGLEGAGDINGDVFAGGSITAANIEGQTNENVTQPPIAWPGVDINDFSSVYYVESTGYAVQNIAPGTYSNCSFGSALSEPPEVFYCGGDIQLAGGVTLYGMLVVSQSLVVSDANIGVANVITAGKNLPALLVGGEVTVETAGKLTVNGLTQIANRMRIGDGAENVDIDIVGGLFIANGDIDGLTGSSVSNSLEITTSPAIASIKTWPTPGDAARWTPAGGAFFRSIQRE
ncbi:MAG: hypothetical protein ACYSR5_07240 [Planctomycetota bacterium]|jgi:hypothetical protein